MSCCGGNCNCGSGCSCGSSCKGCSMYPNLIEKSSASSQTAFLGISPAKKAFDGAEMEAAGFENGCKCGSNCSCDSCGCK